MKSRELIKRQKGQMAPRSKSSAQKVNSAKEIPSAEGADSAFSTSATLSPIQKASRRSKKETSPQKPRSPLKTRSPKTHSPQKTRSPKKTSCEKTVKAKKAPHKGPSSLAIATQSHRRTREMVRMLEHEQLIRYQANTLILAMLEAQAELSIHAYRDILIRAILDSEQLEC